MNNELNKLTNLFFNLEIDNKLLKLIIKIQKTFRGYRLRSHSLPLIMYKIRNYLKYNNVEFSEFDNDGRINSSIDEKKIINILKNKFGDRIKKNKNKNVV